MTLNQRFAVLFGVVYLLVGIVGFFVTGDVGFTAETGNDTLLLELNPLHNIVHLAIGAFWLIGAFAAAGAAKSVNMLIGVVLIIVGVAGFFVSGGTDILALNGADNVVHIVTGVLALAVVMRKPAAAAG